MTAPHDLHDWLARLEDGSRLKRVSCPVDRDTQLACISRWAMEGWARDEEAHAILFEHVHAASAGRAATRFGIPVLVHAFTTRAMYAAAIGASPEDLLPRWAAAVAAPVPPVVTQQAAVHEHVLTGDAVDLLDLPHPVWTPGRDAGPYISSALVITRDPDTGVQNLATYRVQVQGPRRLGLFFGSRLQHGAMHRARWQQRGAPMPVAVAIGAPPAVMFAAAAKTAYGVDEMAVAGGLVGQGIPVVPAKTVDLLVPAAAEIVIEGLMPLDAAADEGPFGEALGYMNNAQPAPFVDVTALCLRQDPLYHGYVQQLPPSDGHLVMEMGVLGPLWHYLTARLRVPGLCDMAIAPGSAGVSTLIVQLDRGRGADPAVVGRAMARLNFGQKLVILVDRDVDIRDPRTVTWALSCRMDPVRNITLLDDTPTYQYDPAVMARAEADGLPLGEPPYRCSLGVIDATEKCQVPALALPPRKLMDEVLADWARTGLPPVRGGARLDRLLQD